MKTKEAKELRTQIYQILKVGCADEKAAWWNIADEIVEWHEKHSREKVDYRDFPVMKISKEPHYQINVNELMNPRKMDSWELGMKNHQAIRAILAVFLAGDICLTQEGYMKLDDSLKSLFIAKEK